MYRIILASNSPRRREILEQAGMSFQVIPSNCEEIIATTDPESVVKELALLKATDVANLYNDNTIVIGADTVVANMGNILGKPADELEAVNMLMNLQGHTHNVYTGVAIVIKETNGNTQTLCFSENTKVRIADMTKEQVMNYVLTGEPMDKAGSYGIQGRFAKYIYGIEGDYYNVVGFPICRFRLEMKKLGFEI